MHPACSACANVYKSAVSELAVLLCTSHTQLSVPLLFKGCVRYFLGIMTPSEDVRQGKIAFAAGFRGSSQPACAARGCCPCPCSQLPSTGRRQARNTALHATL